MRTDITPRIILSLVSQSLGVPSGFICSASRKRDHADARYILVRLIDSYCSQGDKHTAALIGRNRTNVPHARRAFNELLETHNEGFLAQYDKALAAVEEWIQKHQSEAA